MVDRAAEHSADLRRRQVFELSELEHLPVLIGEFSETLAQCLGRLTSRDQPIRWNRWLSPRAVAVEPSVKHFVNRVRQVLARMCASPLLGLVMQDSEQPRAHFGPTLEALNRLQKRDKYILRQVLGVARREPHAARRPIAPPCVLIDDVTEHRRIAGAQALQQDSSSKRHLRSEEHTSELQSPDHLVCRLLLEKKKKKAETPPPYNS